MLSTVLRVLFVLFLACFAGCTKKGGEGSPCKVPKDCKHGFRCEKGRCIGGAESACGYLRRCFPKLSLADKEMLFGEAHAHFGKWLQKAKAKDEDRCKHRIRFIKSINRIVVLNRACGPQVVK